MILRTSRLCASVIALGLIPFVTGCTNARLERVTEQTVAMSTLEALTVRSWADHLQAH